MVELRGAGRTMIWIKRGVVVAVLAVTMVAACAKKKPAPVTSAAPPPAVTTPAPTPAAPPPPPQRVEEAPVAPIAEDTIANRSLEDLNRDSPFKPAFFALDRAELDDAGRA